MEFPINPNYTLSISVQEMNCRRKVKDIYIRLNMVSNLSAINKKITQKMGRCLGINERKSQDLFCDLRRHSFGKTINLNKNLILLKSDYNQFCLLLH